MELMCQAFNNSWGCYATIQEPSWDLLPEIKMIIYLDRIRKEETEGGRFR